MDRKGAIGYLDKKGELNEPLVERAFTLDEEEKIERVMKRGKIYGDPLVCLYE